MIRGEMWGDVGESYFFASFDMTGRDKRPADQARLSREMEILRLLSTGKSLSEIAWLVHSSYKTVANTSSIMRQKLGVRTSAELVRLAIESSLT